MFIIKLIEAVVRISGGVGFHQSRHVVDSGLYGACGLAGCCGSRPQRRTRRPGPRRLSGSVSGPELRLGSLQMPLTKPEVPSLPTPASSAPPSVLRPEHALQPYREESDDEDGYIMGAWHSYTKPGYSAVEDQTLTETMPPPQKSSGFTRVGGGRAHFDTPYAIQSGSRGSLDRQSMELGHPTTSPEFDYKIPPTSFKFGATSSSTNTPSMGILQNHGNNNQPGPSGNRGGGSPSPTIGQATARQNLPHGAMLPAHFRVHSQSAIVVHPGPADPSSSSNGSGNGSGALYIPGKTPLPVRSPSIRIASDEDESLDSAAPRRKPWFRALRNKGHSDGSAPGDEEADPPAGTSGSTPGRTFVVVRKNQGQGQSYGKRPSTTGSSGDDPGQKKSSFVVLRGRDAQSDGGHGGSS
jgi:hypothetical protein